MQLPTIPKYEVNDIVKIAIVQGGAWGDNINSTLMLKPLKNHFKNSIIDIHTSVNYSSAYHNNPYINNIIQYPCYDKNSAINLAISVPPLLVNSNYNIVCAPHPMFNPDRWSSINHPNWGENLIFAWVRALEVLDVPYGDTLETILVLTNDEKSKAINKIKPFENDTRFKNLMEIHGESGQTFWNHDWTERVVRKLASMNQIVFISHGGLTNQIQDLQSSYPSNVIYVGDLSIRECAHIFNYCDRFLSVSSGLSNACNTNHCKKDIQWIETVNSITCSSAAIRKDNKVFWHENDLNKFIEYLSTN